MEVQTLAFPLLTAQSWNFPSVCEHQQSALQATTLRKGHIYLEENTKGKAVELQTQSSPKE